MVGSLVRPPSVDKRGGGGSKTAPDSSFLNERIGRMALSRNGLLIVPMERGFVVDVVWLCGPGSVEAGSVWLRGLAEEA